MMETKLAVAKAIEFVARAERKTMEEMIRILLVEALIARGVMEKK